MEHFPCNGIVYPEKGRFTTMDVINQIIQAIKDIIAKFQGFIEAISSGNFGDILGEAE